MLLSVILLLSVVTACACHVYMWAYGNKPAEKLCHTRPLRHDTMASFDVCVCVVCCTRAVYTVCKHTTGSTAAEQEEMRELMLPFVAAAGWEKLFMGVSSFSLPPSLPPSLSLKSESNSFFSIFQPQIAPLACWTLTRPTISPMAAACCPVVHCLIETDEDRLNICTSEQGVHILEGPILWKGVNKLSGHPVRTACVYLCTANTHKRGSIFPRPGEKGEKASRGTYVYGQLSLLQLVELTFGYMSRKAADAGVVVFLVFRPLLFMPTARGSYFRRSLSLCNAQLVHSFLLPSSSSSLSFSILFPGQLASHAHDYFLFPLSLSLSLPHGLDGHCIQRRSLETYPGLSPPIILEYRCVGERPRGRHGEKAEIKTTARRCTTTTAVACYHFLPNRKGLVVR